MFCVDMKLERNIWDLLPGLRGAAIGVLKGLSDEISHLGARCMGTIEVTELLHLRALRDVDVPLNTQRTVGSGE